MVTLVVNVNGVGFVCVIVLRMVRAVPDGTGACLEGGREVTVPTLPLVMGLLGGRLGSEVPALT